MRTTAACRTGFVEPKRLTQQRREETLCLHLKVTICDFNWRVEVSFPYSFLSSVPIGGIRGVFPFSFGFLCTGYSRKTTLALIRPSAIKEKRNNSPNVSIKRGFLYTFARYVDFTLIFVHMNQVIPERERFF